jgi:L-seryl-tRNA(Ser) seleniumtransferase
LNDETVEVLQQMTGTCSRRTLHLGNIRGNECVMKASFPKTVSPFPSVEAVLQHMAMRVAVAQFGRKQTTDAVRATLKAMRDQSETATVPVHVLKVAELAQQWLEQKDLPSLRPVMNLTGTILHTNLGRAILPEVAVQAVVMAMRQPVNLEYDTATGKRGERDDHVRGLICELTGAEDCVIVNNNAAAVLLVLSSLSVGKETIVSRGELIEIGGSFRIPDIMRRAGAKLREVGTTNRTHLSDYSEAITSRTAAIMKVHTSNYRIEGFTSEVNAKALSALSKTYQLPLIDDLGSGTLVDLTRYGLKYERTVQDALKEGADIVTFSGDKLLGGPQVGIIAGRKDLVRLCARNHLKRALRADKLRLAALAATLKLYRDPDRLPELLPTLRTFTRKRADMRRLAQDLVLPLQKSLGPNWHVDVVDMSSQIGSGALPLETMPSAGLAVKSKDGASGKKLDLLSAAFRQLPVPVIGRIQGGSYLLDCRGMEDSQAFIAQLDHLKVQP